MRTLGLIEKVRKRLLTRMFLLMAVCFSLPLAKADAVSEAINAEHPKTYTVVKGDTLWDISARFLSKPWLWPEIWQINLQIENPHLIYPGDTISLVYVDGQPRLRLQRGLAGRTLKLKPAGTKSIRPEIREVPLELAIPTLRLDQIAGFLVQNRVVEPRVLEAAPYVVQGEAERLVLGAGDRLYVRGVLQDNEAYSLVRRGPRYVDPQTGEVLGREATYIGLGRAVAQALRVATLNIVSTREEVRIGDRVLPTEERRVQANFFPSAPDSAVAGELISVFSGVTQVGQYDVVVINRGAREGLDNGHVLAIYKKGAAVRDMIANEMIQLPSERAGLLMVFRAFEKLSYALVMNSDRPLAVGDEIRNP